MLSQLCIVYIGSTALYRSVWVSFNWKEKAVKIKEGRRIQCTFTLDKHADTGS